MTGEPTLLRRFDVDAIDRRHHPSSVTYRDPTQKLMKGVAPRYVRYCDGCGQHWPCDASRLIGHIEAGGTTRMVADLDAARDALAPFAAVYDRAFVDEVAWNALTITHFRAARLAYDAGRTPAMPRQRIGARE